MTCDQDIGDGCARKHAPSARWVVAAMFLAVLVPGMARGQSALRYDHDISLTYEFDDNVQEELEDPVRAQVAKIGYHGDFLWGGGQQRLEVSYQGGFKRHFGGINREIREQFGDSVPSQFVNEGTVAYLRKVTPRLAVGGEVGIKHRAWTEGLFFLNEDGFLRRTAGLNAVVDLEPVDVDRDARLEFGLEVTDNKYKNLDDLFGSYAWGGYTSFTKEFGEDIEARATYSFDAIRYPGRAALEPGELPQNILTRPGVRQEDMRHELGAELRWFGDVSIVADYWFRYNDSNSFGFRYVSHSVGIQILRPLPWGMLAQVLGQVELRSFLEPVPNVTAGSLDTGDAQNNVLLFRLVKDITDDYSVEARYARYRNESITLNDFYTKNIWSVGMTYRP
jgi:hypothetical protein